MCNLREQAHLKKSYTYYLTNIDDMFRRTYEIKQ
jgi:hydroxymethylglutaryl-CoA synthase